MERGTGRGADRCSGVLAATAGCGSTARRARCSTGQWCARVFLVVVLCLSESLCLSGELRVEQECIHEAGSGRGQWRRFDPTESGQRFLQDDGYGGRCATATAPVACGVRHTGDFSMPIHLLILN